MMPATYTGLLRRYFLALFCWLNLSGSLPAQTDYQGLRLAVFDLKVLKETAGTLSLRCSVANTGRLPLELNGKAPSFPPLVLEMDTLHLPAALQQRSGAVQRAILREKFRLAPGEIRSGLALVIPLQDTLPETPPAPICSELKIDTAFFTQQNERTLNLHFRLRNTGASAVQLAAEDKALVLNAYFVSNNKLTRGAIFAEQIVLRTPRELKEGLLPPGASVDWDLEISTKNRTRFSPHLALEFDPLQALPDCDNRPRIWVME